MIIQPVILSGGSGTRLWPLSREHYPKQLLPLVEDKTMLQVTIARLDGFKKNIEALPPIIVCNEAHRFLVAEQVRLMGKQSRAIILEPAGRNTAPALTLAALEASKDNQDPILLIMPADHVIKNLEKFHEAVEEGMSLADQASLVTFGIVPSGAETGYGYIKMGASSGQTARKIAAFVEKPDAATAQTYLDSGRYVWNSGMFMMRASVWLAELERRQPEMAKACQQALDNAQADADFYRVEEKAFLSCPADSIDYAVMEKLGENDEHFGVVIPLQAGWSDVGAWDALWQVGEKDDGGNVIKGDVYAVDSKNTLMIAEHRFLACIGVEDLVVIETSDAVMVAPKNKTQEVKAIVNRLKAQNRDEYQAHRKVSRPWGCYDSVDAGERFQVKRITVKPGAALSLQMHHHRAEHWIVVAGTARVTRGEEVFLLSENQSTYIPIGVTHRLENPGTLPLEMIEVQSGSYLGEDDIVRFKDTYGRS